MIGFIKLAAVGAVLSCSVAAVYDLPTRKLDAAVSGKFQDRLAASGAIGDQGVMAFAVVSATPAAAPAPGARGKGDRLVAADSDCAGQAWPYLSAACIARRDGGAPRSVRVITIEKRDAVDASTLMRVPQITTAQR